MLQQILGAQEDTSHMHWGNQKRLLIVYWCWPSGSLPKAELPFTAGIVEV